MIDDGSFDIAAANIETDGLPATPKEHHFSEPGPGVARRSNAMGCGSLESDILRNQRITSNQAKVGLSIVCGAPSRDAIVSDR